MDEVKHQIHLTDFEIHEFIQNRNPHAAEIIEACATCQNRLQRCKEVHRQLKKSLSISPDNDLWQRIQAKKQKQIKTTPTKLNTHWPYISIAASLFIVTIFLWNGIQNERTIQNRIQASILQSQKLERGFKNLSMFKPTSSLPYADLAYQLSLIDEDLQHAYSNNEESEKILELWNKRIVLLIDISKTLSINDDIEII